MNQVHGCKALYFAHNFDELLISCYLQGLLNGFLNKLKESERRNRRNRRGQQEEDQCQNTCLMIRHTHRIFSKIQREQKLHCIKVRYLPEIFRNHQENAVSRCTYTLKAKLLFFYYLFLFILDPSQLCPSSHFVPSLFLLPVELPFHFKLNVFFFFYHSCLYFFSWILC